VNGGPQKLIYAGQNKTKQKTGRKRHCTAQKRLFKSIEVLGQCNTIEFGFYEQRMNIKPNNHPEAESETEMVAKRVGRKIMGEVGCRLHR